MKANIHPQFFQATVTCSSCGTKFTLGSTQETFHIELCSHCHPFYTGEERFVDTASKIDKFNKSRDLAEKLKAQMALKKEAIQRKNDAPKTLAEMLAQANVKPNK